MAPFGPRSQANLAGVHPALVRLFTEITKFFDCSILPGSVRTREQQALNVKNGLSQTMDSKHIPGEDGLSHAVDAAPTPQQWDNSPTVKVTKYELEMMFFAGYVKGFSEARPELLGAGLELRLGVDWNMNDLTQDNNFMDWDHFEIHERARDPQG